MFDIVLNFCTAIYDEDTGALIVHYSAIAKRYLRQWFLLDLVSSLPLDRVFCSATEGHNSTRVAKVLRLAKVFRFLRMLRVASRIQELLGQAASDAIRLAKFVGVLLLFGHICACAWHLAIEFNACTVPADALGTPSVICGCDPAVSDCQEWNWLAKYDPEIHRGNSTGARYLVSIYYSVVTLTTLGYGDVLPTNPPERALASALALAGAVAFSFLIGNIGSLAAKPNALDTAAAARLAALADLCALQAVPRETRHRARHIAAHALRAAPHLFHDLDYLPRAARTEIVSALVQVRADRMGPARTDSSSARPGSDGLGCACAGARSADPTHG